MEGIAAAKARGGCINDSRATKDALPVFQAVHR